MQIQGQLDEACRSMGGMYACAARARVLREKRRGRNACVTRGMGQSVADADAVAVAVADADAVKGTVCLAGKKVRATGLRK